MPDAWRSHHQFTMAYAPPLPRKRQECPQHPSADHYIPSRLPRARHAGVFNQGSAIPVHATRPTFFTSVFDWMLRPAIPWPSRSKKMGGIRASAELTLRLPAVDPSVAAPSFLNTRWMRPLVAVMSQIGNHPRAQARFVPRYAPRIACIHLADRTTVARSTIHEKSHVDPPHALMQRLAARNRLALRSTMNVSFRERESQGLYQALAYFAI